MYAVLIVTIVGIICIVVSFMLVGKEEPISEEEENPEAGNRITDDYELNEEEVAVLQKKVSDKISQDVDDIIYNADQSLSTMTNEKMLALGDYAVTVCDEIEKNHKEVMFLYSMLNDKEKDVKELVSEADARISELKKANELAMDVYVAEPVLSDATEPVLPDEPETMMEMMEEEPVVEEDNTNDIILGMKRSGMSIIEIARELGLGVGEVKLVVDLYQGDAK
ncbi:MAG: DUF6115 domain-containing protein [Bacteroides sp.]|nr:DUF6115 domain-containing protein [Bacteroides sp.]MCM1550042.1 DUF6115 domain-containing protein [Clostridium sp.]